jgi:hypothetical protein
MKKNKFLPPKDGITFTRRWNSFIEILKNKNSFNPDIHLPLLETLCTLYQDQKGLEDSLELQGMSYSTGTNRNGTQHRIRPEVQQLNITRNLINKYSLLLDLAMVTQKSRKPNSTGEAAPEAKDWE